jgi:hypothetical protein
MIDDELATRLQAHAVRMHKEGHYDKPNVSAAARDLLRSAVRTTKPRRRAARVS